MNTNEVLHPGENIRPNLTLEDAKSLVQKLYGFRCKSISELDGYDDKNYKITVEEISSDKESEYVLKILNSLDSKKIDFIEAQNDLLLYLCNNSISCPTPIMNLNKKYYALETLESGKHIVRLMKFISGVVLLKVPDVSESLITEIGTFVATLDAVLKKFHHVAYATHRTLWMLNSIPNLREFITAIDDESRREIIEDVIKEFEDEVLGRINSLEKGLIHGDVNEQNILVGKSEDGWKMKSILDFGDSQYSCYLFELAITMTYIMILKKDMDVGGYVMKGYSKIRKIPEIELDLLKICIEARLCQSLVMGAYSIKQDPKNSYILTTSKPGWELLYKLRSRKREDLLNLWRLLLS